mmetsp:Transcript_28258/g.39778  ORF Transcript_28258/g.39778 Transcript_28258/m.39778 type:complete len:482 (+) Transcript_28258:133-1578(+)
MQCCVGLMFSHRFLFLVSPPVRCRVALTPPLSKKLSSSSSTTKLQYTEDDTNHPGESILINKDKSETKQERRKPLEHLYEGDIVSGRVKAIYNYGAFIDIGAMADGLLHKSRISTKYVRDPNDWLTLGDTIQTRILSVDLQKHKIEFTMLDDADNEDNDDGHYDNEVIPTNAIDGKASHSVSKTTNKEDHEIGERTLSADHLCKLRKQLLQKDWDPDTFVEGTVTNVCGFGAFVRFDAKLINPDIEGPGALDGMVHISALSPYHTRSVTDVVKVGDKVEVRLVSIRDQKIDLSMVAAEDEKSYLKRGDRNYSTDLSIDDRNHSTDTKNKKAPSQQVQKLRQDERIVREKLLYYGWDSDQFVSGEITNVVNFGAFVKVDAAELNSNVEGIFRGLVHISVLTNDAVKVGNSFQVRLKGIDGKRVSFSMFSADEETATIRDFFESQDKEDVGATDWKESADKIQMSQPSFKNTPDIEDGRELKP